MDFLAYLEKQSKLLVMTAGYALIGVLGILDFMTGYELAFSLFYMLPIALTTWLAGRQPGILMSLVGSLVCMISDLAARSLYSSPFIYTWNTLMRFAFFVIIVMLLSELKIILDREKELAHKDHLTGAANSRVFYDRLQTEIDRSRRYKNPFTIVYIDLDNFKTMNDKFGHAAGDQVLYFVASQIRNHLRITDVVARLGGDEFALLLPETRQEAAQAVLTKLQQHISAGMQQNSWPVTLSIGALTCLEAPHSTDETIKIADDLMYSVKHGGKNSIKFATFTQTDTKVRS